MDGIYNEIVVCCFCGESLSIGEAAVLNIQPNISSNENQTLFCHRQHLVERILTSIPLHPDFFDEEDD